VRVQPRVDALDVVQVQAHRQQPNRLPDLEHAEAHRARRLLLTGAAARHVVLHRPVVCERREARRRADAPLALLVPVVPWLRCPCSCPWPWLHGGEVCHRLGGVGLGAGVISPGQPAQAD